jgi:hypothetical protein
VRAAATYETWAIVRADDREQAEEKFRDLPVHWEEAREKRILEIEEYEEPL